MTPTIKTRGQQALATSLIDIVFPGDTNHHGTLFGGAGLALMDRVAFIAATRFFNMVAVGEDSRPIAIAEPASAAKFSRSEDGRAHA